MSRISATESDSKWFGEIVRWWRKKDTAHHTIQLIDHRKMHPGIIYVKFIYLCRVPLSHPIHTFSFNFFFWLTFVCTKLATSPFFCSATFLEWILFNFRHFCLKKLSYAHYNDATHPKHSIDMALQWATTSIFHVDAYILWTTGATNTHFAYHSISIRWQLWKTAKFDRNFV